MNTMSTLAIAKSLKGLSDRDLVLGLKSVDETELPSYQTEFYKRFAPYILKVGRQCCQIYPEPEELAKDLTQETFIKAFAAMDKFTVTVGEDAVFKRHIKGWLGMIANRQFLKLYAERKNANAETECTEAEEPAYDQFSSYFEPPREETPPVYVTLLREAMSQLKEIDQHIVNAYAAEGCLDSTRHISAQAMHLLCETYQTTSENIRKRKNRALTKIKAHCLKN